MLENNLVLRYADRFISSGIDTILEHRNVLKARGFTWFAKVGKPLGVPKIRRLDQQLRDGQETYLFLAKAKGRQYVLHRCRMLDISAQPPQGKGSFPSYYRDTGMVERGTLWVKVKTIDLLGDKEIRRLETVSSCRPLLESLRASSSGMFFVRVLPASARA